jgi:dUTP pyrophosphatase
VENVEVDAFCWAVIPTGIALQAPAGFAFQIEDRSGLAGNNGISTRGGVIDNGYTGEIKVILQNESDTDFLVEAGDKIAQVKLERVYTAAFEYVAEFATTARAKDGFGSTGTKSKQ